MSKVLPLLVCLCVASGDVAGADKAGLPPNVVPSGAIELSLAQAQDLAASKNRDLADARRAVEAARADVITAGERPNATLSFNTTSINPHTGVGAGKPWDKTVDTVVRVDQLFERGDKRALRVAAARQGLAASQADLADAGRRTRSVVAAAYFDLVQAQNRLAILRDIMELYQRTLDAAEMRLRAGDVSPTDVARIRVDALRAENDLRQGQADLLRTQSALAYLIGLESSAPQLKATDGWPVCQSVSWTGSIDELVSQRADVKAAHARWLMAEKNRDLMRAQRTRDVTVGMQYEHYPPGGRNMYGVGVSIPLFTGSYYEGEIRRAEVERSAAEAAYERAKAQAYVEIAQARADLEAARARALRYRSDIVQQARHAAEAAEFAYRHGALGVMDVLDARRTLKATLLDAEAAQADCAKASAAWESAVMGYEDDEEKIDR
ncbi:MAG: TolC family protein [Burkholderiales bacterium]|nr:TolC family protein [Burkholderiales bacterium]